MSKVEAITPFRRLQNCLWVPYIQAHLMYIKVILPVKERTLTMAIQMEGR